MGRGDLGFLGFFLEGLEPGFVVWRSVSPPHVVVHSGPQSLI